MQGGVRQLRSPPTSTAVTDRLTDTIGQQSAGAMFGDDTSTDRQSGEQVVEVLKRWRKLGNTLETGETRVHRSRTAHVRKASGAGRQGGEERREEWERGEETRLIHLFVSLFVCWLADVT